MSNFNPTPSELALTSQLFTIADPQDLGIVTGDTAVRILSGANLSHVVLGEVWAIADKDNNGFLTKKGVAIALRLIGYAQKGEAVAEAMLEKPGPLAYIDGVSRPAGAISPPPSSPQSSPSVPSSILPTLTQQDKTKFLKLFIGCGPVNGLLSGEKARDVFVKSKLPYDKLSHIWTLADTKTRGALDSTDFTIGMYLIQASMSSPSLLLPSTLPSRIYDQAVQSLDTNSSVVSHATGGSIPSLGSPLQSSFHIPRQYTGLATVPLAQSTTRPQHTGQQLPQTPTRQSTSGFSKLTASPPVPGRQNTGTYSQPWGVSPEAKASSDKFFDGLDSHHRGYIEGDVAVPFMLESKLPGSELAQIWDLADLHNDGRLTCEGFAVAMHIINSRLSGNEIPSALPLSLVPPSMRSSQPSIMTAMNEPQLDLLLDDTPSGPVLQSQQTSASGQISPPSPFGRNLGKDAFTSSYQVMVPPQTQQSSIFRPDTNKDLLGDDEEEASRPNSLPDNSAEIGNLQNQVSSTIRSLENTRAERTSTEQTVTQQMGRLSQLQTQLSSSRASYETESQLLANLRERLVAQRIDIQRTREELISAESELSATKVEKAEVEGSVLRDKEEVRDLQRRMKEVGAETDALKAGIEKAKKDVRQQKGLLAIARKQLATAETEKLKSTTELEIVQKELEIAQQEKKAIDEHLSELETAPSHTSDDFIHVDSVVCPAPSSSAAAIPLPDTPQSTTPQPPSRLSTNPFERLAMAAMAEASSSFQVSSPVTDDAPVEPSDIFILHPPTSTEIPQTQTSTAVDDIVLTYEPTVSIASGPGTDVGSQVSTLSPVNNDSSFIIPHSNSEQDIGKNVSEEQLPLSGVYPPVVEGDGVFGPLHEMENNGSETSDSDEQPLGAKFSGKSIKEQLLFGDPPSAKGSNLPPGLEPSTSFKIAFDDTFGATGHSINPPTTRKVSPTTSGKSSPKRSRSPVRALSTRTLSSHSIAGALDPFSASTFSHTPLEPPEGHAAPPPTIETVLEPSAGTATLTPSSINDFDEALGKLPTSTKDASPAFKLDSAFDDNFDFSSAVNGITSEHVSLPDANTRSDPSNFETATAHFPPVSAPLPPSSEAKSQATNPIPVVMETKDVLLSSPSSLANGTASVSFDDAFGLNSSVVSNSIGQQSIANGRGLVYDVFGSVSETSGPATAGNTFPTTQPPKPAFADSLSSPLPARPASPPIQPPSPLIRPPSPYQPQVSITTSKKAASPPRASSPKLRVSSSKTFSPEGKSEGSSKHKLNIRFPFGRKDKSKDKEEKRGQSQAHQPPPDSQQLLSPAFEPPLPGTITPAVDDDAEPVKHLAAMGFSRTQCIAALETHGYDMEKALNSLLGAA